MLDEAIEAEVEKYAPQTQRGTAEEFMGILDTYEISNIRTLDYDEAIDSYQCEFVSPTSTTTASGRSTSPTASIPTRQVGKP